MSQSTTTTSEYMKNKIVNVRGIPFDISSILNDVTVSIQNNIENSLNGALKDYELYKSTHDAIFQIPFVRDLYIQNQELISQIEMLDSQTQPIELKINEISPPSPVVMRPHFQIDSCSYPSKFENKKLADNEETSTSTESDSNDSESSEEDRDESQEHTNESASDAEEEDAEEEEEEEEEEVEEEEEADAEEAEEEEEDAEEEDAEEKEEEADAEEEKEEAEEEKEEAEEEEEEEEVYEIVIENITYFTTSEENGDIYECVDGDVGEIVGKFKDKKPVFSRRK